MTIEATIVPADIETAPAEDKPTVAFRDGLKVWLAGGLLCPHCRRPLRASDVTVDDDNGDTAFICGGCHGDVLSIEATTEATS